MHWNPVWNCAFHSLIGRIHDMARLARYWRLWPGPKLRLLGLDLALRSGHVARFGLQLNLLTPLPIPDCGSALVSTASRCCGVRSRCDMNAMRRLVYLPQAALMSWQAGADISLISTPPLQRPP